MWWLVGVLDKVFAGVLIVRAGVCAAATLLLCMVRCVWVCVWVFV